MAETRKRKHGKVEARKSKPMIRFKLGILLLLIVIAFGGCFTLYLISATAQPDYWEKEIIGSTETTLPVEEDAESVTETSASAAINPVPFSERADDSYLSACAFVGDVSEFTSYYQTASGLIFADAVSAMTEADLKNLSMQIGSQNARAVYLWFSLPEDPVTGLETIDTLITQLQKRTTAPLYIMTALPDTNREKNTKTDDWNAELLVLADRLGIHYVDVSTPLKRNDGLPQAIYDRTDAAWAEVGEQLLTHVAK